MSQIHTTAMNGGPVGTVVTITGNVGGAAGPNGVGNLNLVGTDPITVTGNPGLNTLTISVATATTAQIGVTTLATNAETIAGVVTDNAVVPSGLAAKLGLQTLFGVPYGNTTAGAIQWTVPGTDGQVFLGATGAAPAFGTLTSIDGTVTFTPGANTLDLSAAAANILQNQIYYVGKHGNDANNGRNIENAVLTFTQAIVLATAALPTAVNRFAIVCLDDGIYAEAITVPQYVDVFAPSATLTGTIVVNDDSSIKFSRLNVATATIGVLKAAGAVYTNIDIDYITCAGTGIGIIGLAGFINCHWKELYVANGFGIGDLAAAMAHMHLFGGDIYITGTGIAIARANTGSTIGHVDHIADIGAGVGTGMAVFDGTVAINVNTVANNVAYNVSGATSILRLFANSVTGTRTTALGGTDNHWVPPVAMANGELVIGAGVGVDPVVASLTSPGGTITITPGAGSIDLDTAGGVAIQFTTDDANVVVPLAGNVNVLGAHGINTSGAVANTITTAINNTITLGDLVNVTGADALTLTTGDATITAGNINLTNTAIAGTIGIVNYSGNRFIHNYGTNNTFVGSTSGNLTLTVANAIFNTGLGYLTLNAVTTGEENTAIGARALPVCTTSSLNTAIGYGALFRHTTGNAGNGANSAVGYFANQNSTIGENNSSLGYLAMSSATTGSYNTAVGALAMGTGVTTGSYNTAVGISAGSSLGANSSHNILIRHAGLAGDNNTIRIGTQGAGNAQQNLCYVAGITGVNVGNVATVVSIATGTGQLGTTTIQSTDGTVTVTPGANVIELSVPGTGMTWTREAGAAVGLVNNHGYINTNVGLTTFTLPAVAVVGDEFAIIGESAAGWTIAQNAGQNIQFGNLSTAVGVGGSLASSNQYDTVHLVCRVASTTFHVISATGNLTVV